MASSCDDDPCIGLIKVISTELLRCLGASLGESTAIDHRSSVMIASADDWIRCAATRDHKITRVDRWSIAAVLHEISLILHQGQGQTRNEDDDNNKEADDCNDDK